MSVNNLGKFSKENKKTYSLSRVTFHYVKNCEGPSGIAHFRYIKNSNMTRRLCGLVSIFGLVLFVLSSLLGIARQWSREKFAIWSLKPRSHVRKHVIASYIN